MFPPLALSVSSPNHLEIMLAGISADGCVLLGTLGLCLIFFELNRPGRIIPGALGLLLVLFCVSVASRWQLQWWAIALLGLAFLLLLSNLWWRLALWPLAMAVLSLGFGFRFLLRPSAAGEVHLTTAVVCSLLLGVLGAFLSRMALRARRAKAVD